MIRYCNRCLFPDTKPDLFIDEEGVCSACRNYEDRPSIDYEERQAALKEIIKANHVEGKYDCIIPVSGGKDSTYQTVKMLELGATPLCVTAHTDDLSDLGRSNLENIRALGVDHVDFITNPIVRRRINKIALERVGDISWPEHVSIFTVPVRLALQMGIKTIVWGENPQNEYGGPRGSGGTQYLDRRWLEEYGGLLGLRVSDLLDEGFSEQDLIPYRYPNVSDVEQAGIKGLFLGYFYPWDGLANAEIAKQNGFRTYGKMVEGSVVDYENLDNCQTGIHDFFKFLKFGFGRATDLLSMALRRGRITREKAVELSKKRDGMFPWLYLGKPIDEILKDIGMDFPDFIRCCEAFTNWELFKNKDVTKLEKTNYDNI